MSPHLRCVSIQHPLRHGLIEARDLRSVRRLAVEREYAAFRRNRHVVAVAHVAGKDHFRQRVLHAALDPLLKRAIKIDASKSSLLQLVIYGFALVILMRTRPQGALPEGFSIWRWIARFRGRAP